jgi:tetratricopeptide (TPR) repeat protein
MNSKHLLLSLSCAAVLAGCAAPKPSPSPAPPTKASLLQQADSAFKAGQVEAAVATLKVAAKTYPSDKAAWLRIAQISFDCHEYGEAITHAKKVLELDSEDIVAHSLMAVSGLRVSSKSLADLATKKKVISGDMRAEAQNLATILRTSIGGEIIPSTGGMRPHAARVPLSTAVPPVKTAAQGLLDLLNQPNEAGKK